MNEKLNGDNVSIVEKGKLSPDCTVDVRKFRYFVFFSYDGSAYHGWQIQPNARSVQESLNKALTTLLREPIETVGAGRTDTGVNAAFMAAHFNCASRQDTLWLKDKLNRLLPQDIAVDCVRRVKDRAHARFDAKARTYHYHVYTKKNPFLRHFATRLRFVPDFDLMNLAALELLKVRDFTSFSKLHTDVKTNNCNVMLARWVQEGDDLWRFEITADRFLRNMVRAVVGTLLEVGRGRMTIAQFCDVIACKNRCAAGDSVPGNALSLVRIDYPEELFCED